MQDGCVIVTGGTYGLGREITLCLARKGWRVLAFGLEAKQITSIAENAIPALTKEVEDEGLDVTLLDADVTEQGDVDRVIATALASYGRIHAVVNNAAIGPLGTVLDTDPEIWDRIMAVNLRGPFLMARAVVPLMREQGGGAIVNIGSGSGWGKPDMAAYATSKGGLFAMSMALALDHFRDGVRVNTVVPGGGGIVGGMSVGRVGGLATNLDPDAPGSVAGRVINGFDLGNAVNYLISPEGETVSGSVIDVGCFAHQGSSSPLKNPN